jgi:hypothetical protein
MFKAFFFTDLPRRSKHHALSRGMGGEKIRGVVVEECETRGAEALGVDCEVEFPAHDAGLDLSLAIAQSEALESPI